jgi:hypothetical protein
MPECQNAILFSFFFSFTLLHYITVGYLILFLLSFSNSDGKSNDQFQCWSCGHYYQLIAGHPSIHPFIHSFIHSINPLTAQRPTPAAEPNLTVP